MELLDFSLRATTAMAWIDLAVRVTVILLLVAVADLTLSRGSARTRHALWAAGLLGVLALPVLGALAPTWRVPLLPGPLVLAPEVGVAHVELVPPLARPVALPVHATSTSTTIDASTNTSLAELRAPLRLPGWLVIGLAGLVAVVSRRALSLVRLGRLTADAEPADASRQALLAEVARELGLRRTPTLRVSRQVRSPVTWGWREPVILLPEASRAWSDERTRVVLLHEAIHIRHHHWPLWMTAQGVCALYWFHPLVWWAARRFRTLREHACDESVVERGTLPSAYATHLLDIARSVAPGSGREGWLGVGMLQRTRLERRLTMILTAPRPHRRRSAVSIVLATLAVGAVVAVVQPWEEAVAAGNSGFRGSYSDRGDGHHSRIGYENDDFVLDWQDDALRLSLRIEEPDGVTFNREGDDVRAMESGSYVVVRTSADDNYQRLRLRSRNGELEHEWTVNGEDRPFEDEARGWMSRALAVSQGLRERSELLGRESSLRGEISSVRGRESSLRGRISSIQGRRSSLRGKISSIQGRVSSLRGRISSIRGHESSLRGRISSLSGKISSLRAQMGHTVQLAGDGGAELERLNRERNALIEREIDRLRDAIVEVEAEIVAYDAAARVREVEAEIEVYDAPARIAEVEDEIAGLDVDGRVIEVEDEIEALDVEGRVRELEREIAELEARDRADAIQRRIDPIYEELKELVRRIR